MPHTPPESELVRQWIDYYDTDEAHALERVEAIQKIVVATQGDVVQRLAAVEAALPPGWDKSERSGMDEVDYEALRKRALVAREAVKEPTPVQAVTDDGSPDLSRKKAVAVTAALTAVNIITTIAGQVL